MKIVLRHKPKARIYNPDSRYPIPGKTNTSNLGILTWSSSSSRNTTSRPTSEPSSMREAMLDFISSILGLIDIFIPFVLRLVDVLCCMMGPKFYSRGYGDMSRYFRRRDALMKELEHGRTLGVKPILQDSDIFWKKTENRLGNSVTVQEGSFVSPAADDLPKESRNCRFRLVRPAVQNIDDDDDYPYSSRETYIMILPGVGETGNWEDQRYRLAKKLAMSKGYSSIILMAPLYGNRKPSDQTMFFVNSVSLNFLQTLAVYEETAMLARYFLRKSSSSRVCLTGFSWGAGCAVGATGIALSVMTEEECRRLCCASYAPPVSFEAFPDGALRPIIDERAVLLSQEEHEDAEDDNDNDVDDDASIRQRRKKFHDVMKEMKISLTLEPLKNRKNSSNGNNNGNKIGALRCCAMARDGIIGPRLSRDFWSFLRESVPCQSPIVTKWLPGGHASASFLRSYYQYNLIIDTIDDLRRYSMDAAK